VTWWRRRRVTTTPTIYLKVMFEETVRADSFLVAIALSSEAIVGVCFHYCETAAASLRMRDVWKHAQTA
jgi:hypothetical protein